jgi:hypothetical protein
VTSSNYADQISTLRGRDVFGRDGEKIGTVGQIYADRSGRPTWASVHTGLFGLRQSLVPLTGADITGDDRLQVPFDKATVKDAPNVDHEVDEPLTSEQVRELYRHYDIGWDEASTGDYAEGYTAGAQHTRASYQQPDGSGSYRDAEGETSGLRRFDAGRERGDDLR